MRILFIWTQFILSFSSLVYLTSVHSCHYHPDYTGLFHIFQIELCMCYPFFWNAFTTTMPSPPPSLHFNTYPNSEFRSYHLRDEKLREARCICQIPQHRCSTPNHYILYKLCPTYALSSSVLESVSLLEAAHFTFW